MATASSPDLSYAPPTGVPALTEPPATLTLKEYLQTTYHPDVDFVDDHIEERHLGELGHGTLQGAITAWFYIHRAEWNIRVVSEYRTRVSGTRIRIPDVAVVVNDEKRERVRITPALLAIEILSPEDRLQRVLLRLDEFLAMGVPNVWLFDPQERAAYTYTQAGLKLVTEPRILIPESPIYLDLPEVFSSLD